MQLLIEGAPNLKRLDLTNCTSIPYSLLESGLPTCHVLEYLSVRGVSSNIFKNIHWLQLLFQNPYFMKLDISDNMLLGVDLYLLCLEWTSDENKQKELIISKDMLKSQHRNGLFGIENLTLTVV
jgi:hypothetical protein